MSIYAREDFVLQSIRLNVIVKCMLPGQQFVCNGLCSNGFTAEQLKWPTRSPDLSPIEHVYDILDQCERDRNNVNNVADLSPNWNHITIHKLHNLTRRIRRQVMDVETANRDHTKYWIAWEFFKPYPPPLFFCDIFGMKMNEWLL